MTHILATALIIAVALLAINGYAEVITHRRRRRNRDRAKAEIARIVAQLRKGTK